MNSTVGNILVQTKTAIITFFIYSKCYLIYNIFTIFLLSKWFSPTFLKRSLYCKNYRTGYYNVTRRTGQKYQFFPSLSPRVKSRFSFITRTRHAFYWKTRRVVKNVQIFVHFFAICSMLSKLFKTMRTLILYCNDLCRLCFISREKLYWVLKFKISNKNTQYISVV